jgi:hypothetical protein
MRFLSSGLPRERYGRIEMVVLDQTLAPSADRFFERTTSALDAAASRAPGAFGHLLRDVRQVVLSAASVPSPYHRFQLALLVSPRVAFEADLHCYTAWLLFVSGFSISESVARERVLEFEQTLEQSERTRVRSWLVAELALNSDHGSPPSDG